MKGSFLTEETLRESSTWTTCFQLHAFYKVVKAVLACSWRTPLMPITSQGFNLHGHLISRIKFPTDEWWGTRPTMAAGMQEGDWASTKSRSSTQATASGGGRWHFMLLDCWTMQAVRNLKIVSLESRWSCHQRVPFSLQTKLGQSNGPI